jgi:hypothetical protein
MAASWRRPGGVGRRADRHNAKRLLLPIPTPFWPKSASQPYRVNVAMTEPANRWHVAVRLEDVPEAGLHFALVADEQVRASLAALAGVRDLARLEASIDVARHGGGLRATGRVYATVGQNCVVTLEPLETGVDEAFDVTFAPVAAAAAAASNGKGGEADEPPEPMMDGTADLGAIATEFLLLGIDPYPRKPGAVFASPDQDMPAAGPFAALAKLKMPGNQ